MLKKKAEDVARIMGGTFSDFIDVVRNMPIKSSVDQIIDNLLSSLIKKPTRDVPESEKPVEVVSKSGKTLKKKYSPKIQRKATEIAEVLGEEAEVFYGVVDAYWFSSANEIIEIILGNPDVIEKFSSYKPE